MIFFSIDSDHPKKTCAIIFKILNVIYFLVGVALAIVGGVYIGMMPDSGLFPIVLIIAGVVVIVSAIFGLLGSGFTIFYKIFSDFFDLFLCICL